MPQSRPSVSPKIILVGEDDPDDQEFLREVFATVDSSFSLVFVNNGSQIIEYMSGCIDGTQPCLILLDYNMPEMNGADILSELKKNGRCDDIPKIVWSTSSSATYKNKCLELGATDYLVKPSSMQALMEIAKRMIVYANRQAG